MSGEKKERRQPIGLVERHDNQGKFRSSEQLSIVTMLHVNKSEEKNIIQYKISTML